MTKRVAISPHAREQIRERRLSEVLVREAVQNPDQVVMHGARKAAHKRVQYGGKEYLLRVVYEEEADQLTIITVYQTSKISKYWRPE